MLKRYYYANTITDFVNTSNDEILGVLSYNNEYSLEQSQRNAWIYEIQILKEVINKYDGHILFEYSIPRMGRRIDVVLIIKNVIFILEFKVGERSYLSSSIDQVWDYALDLKNFHETSHNCFIAPILIATEAEQSFINVALSKHNDKTFYPIKTNSRDISSIINTVLLFTEGDEIRFSKWASGRYSPTPTIIEAAMALYNDHSVDEISRNDASAINLSKTSNAISMIIDNSRENKQKSICFVTGVPGAGKTLVGLNVATKSINTDRRNGSVFLSGNGPLVDVLREALTRDKVNRKKELGIKIKKGEVFREVKMFIQNVHHFRDECLIDKDNPPYDHVAIFDEAQRAWDITQTTNFMKRRKNVVNFNISEPEFLISCLDRHDDWAVIVCLVGGGQEINTGEAGISEWIESLNRSFPDWNIYISQELTDNEYAAGNALELINGKINVKYQKDLHLSVSLRSFRAEHLSALVKSLLDRNIEKTIEYHKNIKDKYPIVITRDLKKAKEWLKEKARGSERYGIIVSSNAQRLKPHAIDVKSPVNPIHWFLNGKEDIRSSYYLEDVATEFQIQGLELDWACITWDADFRYSEQGWSYYSFVGEKWYNVRKDERKLYLKNAYRVLLTRARQGMVIVVPPGDNEDPTRNPAFYNKTYQYLKGIGFQEL